MSARVTHCLSWGEERREHIRVPHGDIIVCVTVAEMRTCCGRWTPDDCRSPLDSYHDDCRGRAFPHSRRPRSRRILDRHGYPKILYGACPACWAAARKDYLQIEAESYADTYADTYTSETR